MLRNELQSAFRTNGAAAAYREEEQRLATGMGSLKTMMARLRVYQRGEIDETRMVEWIYCNYTLASQSMRSN